MNSSMDLVNIQFPWEDHDTPEQGSPQITTPDAQKCRNQNTPNCYQGSPGMKQNFNILAKQAAIVQGEVVSDSSKEKIVPQDDKVNQLQSALEEVEKQREEYLTLIMSLEEQTRRIPYLEQQLQLQKVENSRMEVRLRGAREEAMAYKLAASKAAMETEELKQKLRDMEGRIRNSTPQKEISFNASTSDKLSIGRSSIVSKLFAGVEGEANSAKKPQIPNPSNETLNGSESEDSWALGGFEAQSGDEVEGNEEEEGGDEEYLVMRKKLSEMRAMVEETNKKEEGRRVENEEKEEEEDEEDEWAGREPQAVILEELDWSKEELGRLTQEVCLLEASLSEVSWKLAVAEDREQKVTKQLMEAESAREAEVQKLTGSSEALRAEAAVWRKNVEEVEEELKRERRKGEEASRNVGLLEREKVCLEADILEKSKSLRDLSEEKEEAKRNAEVARQRLAEVETRLEGVEVERSILEMRLQEGEIKAKMMEGGWRTLQERVQSLHKEVMEERLRGGLQRKEEEKVEEEARARGAMAAQEALHRLEEEKAVLEERCEVLEGQVAEKEREIVRLCEAHEREICSERLRMKAVVRESEGRRRERVEVELARARELKSRENDILNEEVSRLRNRLIQMEIKPRGHISWPT